jgi:hypothetical protein
MRQFPNARRQGSVAGIAAAPVLVVAMAAPEDNIDIGRSERIFSLGLGGRILNHSMPSMVSQRAK